MFQQLAAERGITIERNLTPLSVHGDPDRLGEVVANLVNNALQYNQPGGRVDVTLSEEAGSAVLRIADTGSGIPESDQPHIFERFYRVDKARSRSVDGSGLGLAITKWIIDAHDGSIAYETGASGGAVFVVRLSRYAETAAQPNDATPTSEPTTSGTLAPRPQSPARS